MRKKVMKLFGAIFFVAAYAMMIACAYGLILIIGTGFSPAVISFFETEVTSIVRVLAVAALFSGIISNTLWLKDRKIANWT